MRVTVSVPDNLGKATEEIARQEGISVSAFYARAVEERVEQLRRQQAAERINRHVGRTSVAPDALDQLSQMRRHSDRPIC